MGAVWCGGMLVRPGPAPPHARRCGAACPRPSPPTTPPFFLHFSRSVCQLHIRHVQHQPHARRRPGLRLRPREPLLPPRRRLAVRRGGAPVRWGAALLRAGAAQCAVEQPARCWLCLHVAEQLTAPPPRLAGPLTPAGLACAAACGRFSSCRAAPPPSAAACPRWAAPSAAPWPWPSAWRYWSLLLQVRRCVAAARGPLHRPSSTAAPLTACPLPLPQGPPLE